MSPSPRQRTIKAQSMPIVPSVMQIYNAANLPANQRQAQQASPPTATISPQSKRTSSPPAITQASPNLAKLPSPPNQHSHLREEAVQAHHFPPAPIHAMSQPNIHQAPPPPPQHSLSQPNIHAHINSMNPTMGYPRPINRIAAPHFLTQFHTMEENWQMTEELMAEIERADYAQAMSQQPPVPGMSGVAYAGGAASGAVYVREVPSPLKDPLGDRVRANERASPKDVDSQGSNSLQRSRSMRIVEREKDSQPSDTSRARERPLPASQAGSPSYSPLGYPQQRAPTPERTSPPYHTPTGSSGGESVTAVDVDYVSYKRDSYQNSSHRIPTPPTARKVPNTDAADNSRVTPPAVSKLSSNTPPLQAMKTRTPDKSLPVQEEPEDDIAAFKNSDYGHNEDDDDTLIENDMEFPSGGHEDHEAEPESYTPRSPTVNLPEPYPVRQYAPQPTNQRLANLGKHHRNGSTDQLGLRSFDAAVFEKPPVRSTEERQHDLRHQHSRTFSDTRGSEQQQ
ncbi:hypothetical protein K503DRAFT_566416, partial [Rhizopogon vinicolor AM-OR11-026]